MAEPSPDLDHAYSVRVGKFQHRYSLSGRRLSHQCNGSGLTWNLDLEPGGFSLKKRWVTQPLFRAGLALVAGPSLAFAVTWSSGGGLEDQSAAGWVLRAMIPVGCVLIGIYRRIDRAWLLRTPSGDGLLIFRDPARPEVSEQFIACVKRLWYDGGAYFRQP